MQELKFNIKNERESLCEHCYQSKIISIRKMLSSIAHKWRQPLNEINSIVSNIDLDYNYDLMSEKSLDLQLKNIEDSTKYLSNTLDDFYEFMHPLHPKFKFHIKDVIEQVLDFTSGTLTQNNIECEVKIVEDMLIQGSPNEYMQVIIEILNNSIEVFDRKRVENPKIEIIAQNHQNRLLLQIKDNGGGVPEDLKIFDAYIGKKKDSTSKGLGLYIAKIIIENMDGEIIVKNDEAGAVFSILV